MDLHTLTTRRGARWTLDVSHRACSARTASAEGVVALVEDPTEAPNTLTRICVLDGATETPIHLYWTSDSHTRNSVSLLAVERTARLFVGAGKLLGIVDVHRGSCCSEHRVELFWSFASKRDHVLARSELECMLFDASGVLLGKVPVDPPWEERETDEGIVFDCPVFGRQLLEWPSERTGRGR